MTQSTRHGPGDEDVCCLAPATQVTIDPAALSLDLAAAPVDKWTILDAAGLCPAALGVSWRELNVLRALVSFLPGREITPGPFSAIVHPSNEAILARLNGMPMSTMRRHLARLVAAGLVERNDSPNCKRYVRRGMRGEAVRSFGFDLSPLARHAVQILSLAEEAAAEASALACLRETVSLLRRDLMARAPEDALLAEIPALRRLALPALRQWEAALLARLAALPAADAPRGLALPDSKVSTSTGQSGQHNERILKDSSVDQPVLPAKAEPVASSPAPAPRGPVGSAENAPGPSLTAPELAALCPEVLSYYPEAGRSWPDLEDSARRIAPMLGIDGALVSRAFGSMGRRVATISILCLLQRLPEIARPGGYLRRLVERAETGGFSCAGMLAKLRQAIGPAPLPVPGG